MMMVMPEAEAYTKPNRAKSNTDTLHKDNKIIERFTTGTTQLQTP